MQYINLSSLPIETFILDAPGINIQNDITSTLPSLILSLFFWWLFFFPHISQHAQMRLLFCVNEKLTKDSLFIISWTSEGREIMKKQIPINLAMSFKTHKRDLAQLKQDIWNSTNNRMASKFKPLEFDNALNLIPKMKKENWIHVI